MNELDRKLFTILNELTEKRFRKYKRYFENDSKPFINKIVRDYQHKSFPVHVLKQIEQIDRCDYHSAVCILRGALPYSILFEAAGWKMHYVICGRKDQHITQNRNNLRFNRSVDKRLHHIKGKRILIIENNVFSGNTPYRTMLELHNLYNIKKSDLFLDYFVKNNKFESNAKWTDTFRKIYVASKIKVSKKEKNELLKLYLERLQNL